MSPAPRGHSTTTLIAACASTLMLGVIIGVVVMMVARPAPEETTAAPTASTSAEVVPSASVEASGDAPAPKPAPRPGMTPAQRAAAAKLAKLRKKVKSARSKQIDPECAKYFKGKLPAGYVYSGGKFDENAFVAAASGCSPVAKAAKAPWFCCRK